MYERDEKSKEYELKLKKEVLLNMAKNSKLIEIVVKSVNDVKKDLIFFENFQNLALYYIMNENYILNYVYKHIKLLDLEKKEILLGFGIDNFLSVNELILIAIVFKG